MKKETNSTTKEEKAENVMKILEDKENLIRSALKTGILSIRLLKQ
jgi:hypothetical protein